jgi:hypothetical protein
MRDVLQLLWRRICGVQLGLLPTVPMIIPPTYPNASAGDRLAGRKIRIGVVVDPDAIAEQRLLAPDSNITFGTSGADVITVPGWSGPEVQLISNGRWLALGPGMSLTMCHDAGEDRMEGSFEELSQAGVTFPLFINVSRLNIRVRKGVVMLMEYMPDAAATAAG